jgi:hypothetical protein
MRLSASCLAKDKMIIVLEFLNDLGPFVEELT